MLKYKLQTTVLIFSLLALSLSLSAIAADEKKPDATVEIEAKQLALVITGVRGSGTLHFQGQSYPFNLKSGGLGLSVAASKMHASGEVFNLQDINDFPGIYTTIRTSAAIGVSGGQNLRKYGE